MRILHVNECAEWCRDHGAQIADPFELASDPALGHTARILFAPSGSIGLEAAALASCVDAITPYDAALLWVREWGIWPSSEDWPRFYAARGVHGERQSLGDKPGHLFGPTDEQDLALFLRLILDQGWGGHLLAARGDRIARRLWVSHDGWVELHSTEPVSFSLPAT